MGEDDRVEASSCIGLQFLFLKFIYLSKQTGAYSVFL